MDLAAALLYAALSGTPAINVPEAGPLNSRYAVRSRLYIDLGLEYYKVRSRMYIDLGLKDFEVRSESDIDVGEYDFEVSSGDE